jgi:hypothetical protein
VSFLLGNRVINGVEGGTVEQYYAYPQHTTIAEVASRPTVNRTDILRHYGSLLRRTGDILTAEQVVPVEKVPLTKFELAG